MRKRYIGLMAGLILNWPAVKGQRGTHDKSAPFGAAGNLRAEAGCRLLRLPPICECRPLGGLKANFATSYSFMFGHATSPPPKP